MFSFDIFSPICWIQQNVKTFFFFVHGERFIEWNSKKTEWMRKLCLMMKLCALWGHLWIDLNYRIYSLGINITNAIYYMKRRRKLRSSIIPTGIENFTFSRRYEYIAAYSALKLKWYFCNFLRLLARCRLFFDVSICMFPFQTNKTQNKCFPLPSTIYMKDNNNACDVKKWNWMIYMASSLLWDFSTFSPILIIFFFIIYDIMQESREIKGKKVFFLLIKITNLLRVMF